MKDRVISLGKRYGIAFLLGVVTLGIGAGLYHLYNDHRAFHVLVAWAVKVSQAAPAAGK